VGAHLVAVADGLGGHVAGDMASSTVINVLQRFDVPTAPDALADTLGKAVKAASDALSRKIADEPALAGMGTTLVAMMRSGLSVVIANVGDSRAYLLRDGTLIRLTDDHVIGRLVADASQVPNLAEKIARFLDGRVDGRSPDLSPLHLQAGDRVLLCSDGLSAYVTHDVIHCALNTLRRPDEAADGLIELAIEQGAPDNVTVIVIDVR
jgi:PPM family protein phosphatase